MVEVKPLHIKQVEAPFKSPQVNISPLNVRQIVVDAAWVPILAIRKLFE